MNLCLIAVSLDFIWTSLWIIIVLISNRSTYVLHEFLLYMSKQILSRDSVTVAVDAVVYYRVQNPTIAVSNVENFR